MSQKDYKKLPGKGIRTQGFFSVSRGYSSLWLGENHLLQVDSLSGYVEEYKRFYFRDIQAITVRRTPNGLAWNVAFGAMVLTCALIALGITSTIGSAILYTVAGFFLLFLIVNAALGPTCSCHLKTAVQSEQLPSFNRLRNARKSLASIRPLIEQAQGPLLPGEIAQHFETAAPQSSVDFPAAASVQHAAILPPPLVKSYKGIAHPLFFGGLLLSGLMDIIHIYFHGAGFLAFETLASCVVIILGIVALTKQHGTNLGKPVRTITWISGVYLGVLVCVGYIQMVALGVSDPEMASDQWSMMKKYSEIAPLETPWLLVVLIVNCVISSGLGLAGLLFFKQWRNAKVPVAPPPIPASSNP